MLEVGAKAWTTMFADVVPFLEESFPNSPPTVLDVAGESLPLAGYLVGTFSVVSSMEALLGFPAPWFAPCRLAMVVPQAVLFDVARQDVIFFGPY